MQKTRESGEDFTDTACIGTIRARYRQKIAIARTSEVAALSIALASLDSMSECGRRLQDEGLRPSLGPATVLPFPWRLVGSLAKGRVVKPEREHSLKRFCRKAHAIVRDAHLHVAAGVAIEAENNAFDRSLICRF